MDIKVREKVSTFDRVLRQRSNNHLKDSERHSLRLMESVQSKNNTIILKRIDKLRNSIVQVRNDIEYGSFVSLPTFRSGRRFHTGTPTHAD